MNDICVVIIRLKNDDEIISIFNSENDGIIKVEYPHYVKPEPTTGKILIVPYCPLSDEIFFEFTREDIKFLVTANNSITYDFIEMVNNIEQNKEQEIDDIMELEETIDKFESMLKDKFFIISNDTKH